MGFNILDLLLPRETKFFTYMIQQVECFIEAAAVFKDLITNLETLRETEIKQKIHEIKEFELKGDCIEYKIIDELNKTFITPLDREDIHTLAINIDRSTDILNSISRKIEIYKIKNVPANVIKFADIICEISKKMKTILTQLKDKEKIDEVQARMHALENEADELFHICMEELFSQQYEPVDIIRYKEIYEHLESVVDSADYIGKLVRGIKVKQG